MLSKRNGKRRIVIRVDANAEIGLGHLTRCLALAEMVMDEYEVSIAIQNPPDYVQDICNKFSRIILPENKVAEADFREFNKFLSGNEIVVLDGRLFDSLYQGSVKKTGCKLVCIDDLHSGHFLADAVINRNPAIKTEDYDKEWYTRLYIGFSYSMVPIKFQKQIKQERDIENFDTLFICFGGSDPFNITLKTLKISIASDRFKRINVVTGSAYSNSAELNKYALEQEVSINLYSNINQAEMIGVMENSSIAICPASSIVFEIFCIGLNLMTGYYVDDQKSFSQYIHNENLGLSIGDLSFAKSADFLKNFPIAAASNQYKKQKQVMDSNQVKSIKAIFEEL